MSDNPDYIPVLVPALIFVSPLSPLMHDAAGSGSTSGTSTPSRRFRSSGTMSWSCVAWSMSDLMITQTGHAHQIDALHEICGRAGLDASGRVVVGRAALQLDLNFTIKSLLIFQAIGKEQAVARAPDGPELLDAVSRALITPEQMDDMIVRHLDFLCGLAGLRVTRIGLSYPDFLCSGEDPTRTQFELYLDFLQKKVQQVYGKSIGNGVSF